MGNRIAKGGGVREIVCVSAKEETLQSPPNMTHAKGAGVRACANPSSHFPVSLFLAKAQSQGIYAHTHTHTHRRCLC